MNLDELKNLNFRDPRVLMRLILGVLLLGNLIAFYFVLYPLGGSPEELDAQLQTLVDQAGAQRKSLDRLRMLTTKVQSARNQAGSFELTNFTDRRVVYSTLVNEITQAADSAGIKLKDHALQNEDIEGSDTLGMITINANYEGTYGDLLNFVNRLDRSERFVIIDSLAATPQQGTNQLNVTMKMNLFVRNTPDAQLPKPVTKGTQASEPPASDSSTPAPAPEKATPKTGTPPVSQPPAPLSGSQQLGTPPTSSAPPGSRVLGTPPTSSPLPGSRILGTPPTSSPLPGSRDLGTPPTTSPLSGAPTKGVK